MCCIYPLPTFLHPRSLLCSLLAGAATAVQPCGGSMNLKRDRVGALYLWTADYREGEFSAWGLPSNIRAAINNAPLFGAALGRSSRNQGAIFFELREATLGNVAEINLKQIQCWKNQLFSHADTHAHCSPPSKFTAHHVALSAFLSSSN